MPKRRVVINDTVSHNTGLRREGASGKTRICVRCYEPTLNAVHPEQRIIDAFESNGIKAPDKKSWYCFSCIKRLEAEVSKTVANRKMPPQEIRDAFRNRGRKG